VPIFPQILCFYLTNFDLCICFVLSDIKATEKKPSLFALFQPVDETPAAPVDAPTASLEEFGAPASAVFVLDDGKVPHVTTPRPTHSHEEVSSPHHHFNAVHEDVPDPVVYEDHTVFLHDSVKLTHATLDDRSHKHAHHTHGDSAVTGDGENKTSTSHHAISQHDRKISFKEEVEQIPVPDMDDMLQTDDPSGATATPANKTDSNPFACVIPSIFCGV
jgi:hypothetical protein